MPLQRWFSISAKLDKIFEKENPNQADFLRFHQLAARKAVLALFPELLLAGRGNEAISLAASESVDSAAICDARRRRRGRASSKKCKQKAQQQSHGVPESNSKRPSTPFVCQSSRWREATSGLLITSFPLMTHKSPRKRLSRLSSASASLPAAHSVTVGCIPCSFVSRAFLFALAHPSGYFRNALWDLRHCGYLRRPAGESPL